MTDRLERIFDTTVYVVYGLITLAVATCLDLIHRARHGGRGQF